MVTEDKTSLSQPVVIAELVVAKTKKRIQTQTSLLNNIELRILC